MSSTWSEITNNFRRFKLGNSLFKDRVTIDNLVLRESKVPSGEIIRSQMRQRMSDHILRRYPNAIKEEDTGQQTEFNLEMLVLEMSEFKTIVEAAIEMIPQDDIDKIKGGKVL